jgi:predicted RecA/RadA family phage recombinase
MKTFSQTGKVLTLTAPTGGVVSGTAYQIGSIVVVATETVAQTLPFEGVPIGVFDVPKVADEPWTEGMKVYWDDSEGKFTLDPDTATNPLVGVAVPPIVPLVVTLASTALAADLAIDNAALTLQVLDYATLAGGTPPTVTVTVNGTPTVLTEGTEWTASTDDDTTATSLAAAITAIVGVDAAAVTDTVTVTPSTGITAASAATGRVRLDGAAR